MLERLRGLLDVEAGTVADLKLRFLLDSTCYKVKNYCNLPDVPEGLECVVVELVTDAYKAGDAKVLSLAEGEATVKFSDVRVAALLLDYTAQLNRYRRIRTVG